MALNGKKVVVLNKRSRLARIHGSVSSASRQVGIHRTTLAERLPYWESSDWLVFYAEKQGRTKT